MKSKIAEGENYEKTNGADGNRNIIDNGVDYRDRTRSHQWKEKKRRKEIVGGSHAMESVAEEK